MGFPDLGYQAPGGFQTRPSVVDRASGVQTHYETVFTCLSAACRFSWFPSAAAVRAGDDFKQVAVRVFEVDTASAVVVIDLT